MPQHPQQPQHPPQPQPHPRTPGLRPARFYVAAVRTSYLAEDLIADPSLLTLAAEDAAWRFSVEDWTARKPSWWRLPAARAWRREGDVLVGERVRMKAAAREADRQY